MNTEQMFPLLLLSFCGSTACGEPYAQCLGQLTAGEGHSVGCRDQSQGQGKGKDAVEHDESLNC